MRLLHSIIVNMGHFKKCCRVKDDFQPSTLCKLQKEFPSEETGKENERNSHWKGPVNLALYRLGSALGSSSEMKVSCEKSVIPQSPGWVESSLIPVYMWSCDYSKNNHDLTSDHWYQWAFKFLLRCSGKGIKNICLGAEINYSYKVNLRNATVRDTCMFFFSHLYLRIFCREAHTTVGSREREIKESYKWDN